MKVCRRSALVLLTSAGVGLVLAGCHGTIRPDERHARSQLQDVTETYRPKGQRPTLPVLTANSSLGDFLNYALLNEPKVEAAYYNWVASVERITTARSLPDPQLTFQMDIQSVVTSLMPGLMMSFPGMGKLKAAGAVAAAETESKYFAFKTASLQSAYAVKSAYYQLYFLDEKIRVNQENLSLLSELEKLARARNEVGQATLRDKLQAQIEQDKLRTEIANLEDSRSPLLARFKAALGMRAEEPAPPVPSRFESTPLDLTSEELFKAAFAQNLRLKAMQADVRAAEASLTLAYKARMPDTSLGLMADAKASPVLYRPWGTVSLPIWRDKLAAQIAEAQANKRAGEARLSAEEIALTADFAERLFLYREASRNLELLQHQLLPRQRQSLAAARAAYLSGQNDFRSLSDAEQTWLRFGLDQVEASTQRELSLAELSLIIQGMPPSGSPPISAGIAIGAPAAPMGTGAGGMLPGNSAPSKKGNQGGM